MRDNNGDALAGAHVLGFLRRICKLLFYGIKPVFVFDGGAPVLKRNTIVSKSALAHVKAAPNFVARASARSARLALRQITQRLQRSYSLHRCGVRLSST